MEIHVDDLPISKSILENVSKKQQPKLKEKDQVFHPNKKQEQQPQIENQNEFLIQFQIQEQMKKYQKTKVQAQHLEQQDKNNIKLQVWQQLFGKGQAIGSEQQQIKPRLQSCQTQANQQEYAQINQQQQLSKDQQSKLITDNRQNEESSQVPQNSFRLTNNTRFNSQNIQKSQASETQNFSNSQGQHTENITSYQQNYFLDKSPQNSQLTEIQKYSGTQNKKNLDETKKQITNQSKYSDEGNYSNNLSQKYVQELQKSEQEFNFQKSVISQQSYYNQSKVSDINDSKNRITSQKQQKNDDANFQKSQQEEWKNSVQQKLQQIENWNNSKLQPKNDKDWNLTQKEQTMKNQSYRLPNYSQNYFKPEKSQTENIQSQENLSLTPGTQQGNQSVYSNNSQNLNQSSYSKQSQNNNQQFAQTSNLKNLDYKIQYMEYNNDNQDEEEEYQENIESIDNDLNNRSMQKVFDQMENLKQQSLLQHIQEEEESHFEQKSLAFKNNSQQNDQNKSVKESSNQFSYRNDSQLNMSQQNQSLQESQMQQSNEFLPTEKSDEKSKQQFIQYDIELEEDDLEQRRSKFEALKKRKLEEIERAKQERQKKRIWDDQNEFPTPTMSNTPKRERSPMMPSASMRSKSKMDDDMERSYSRPQNKANNYVNKSQERKGDNNIFKDDSIQYLPPKGNKQRQKEDQLDKTNKNPKPPNDRPRMVSATRASPKIEVAQTPSTLRLKKNNKQILKNAIINVCLAGEPNKKDREYVLSEMERCESEHFIILLKGAFGRMVNLSLNNYVKDFRALYGMSQQDETPHLIFSIHKSPISLDPFEVTQYFKYDSGAKEFKSIPVVKSFSFAIDAVKIKR